MSKKRFTSGLESIFSEPMEPIESAFQVSEEEETQGAQREKPKSKRRRSKSAKNFTSDLDSLFEDTIVRNIEEKQIRKVKTHLAKRKKNRKAVTGLDSLIRKTGESSYLQLLEGKKRVTFLFGKEEYERLVKIAKRGKNNVKEVLTDLISEYIDEYEKKQRSIL